MQLIAAILSLAVFGSATAAPSKPHGNLQACYKLCGVMDDQGQFNSHERTKCPQWCRDEPWAQCVKMADLTDTLRNQCKPGGTHLGAGSSGSSSGFSNNGGGSISISGHGPTGVKAVEQHCYSLCKTMDRQGQFNDWEVSKCPQWCRDAPRAQCKKLARLTKTPAQRCS